MKDIRLLVIDERAIVREGIRVVVERTSDIRLLVAVAVPDDAAPHAGCADVAIMALSNRRAAHEIRDLRQAWPSCRVVVLSDRCDEEIVHAAVAAGARAYLRADTVPAELIAAIRAVHSGRRYLSVEAHARLADYVGGPSLTPREQEVLQKLAAGKRNKCIARSLNVTEETVKGHVKNILVKLGAGNRWEAACKATERGVI